jgi:hypothetical protein
MVNVTRASADAIYAWFLLGRRLNQIFNENSTLTTDQQWCYREKTGKVDVKNNIRRARRTFTALCGLTRIEILAIQGIFPSEIYDLSKNDVENINTIVRSYISGQASSA